MSKLPTLYAKIDHYRSQNWQAWQPIQSRYQQFQLKQDLKLLIVQGTVEDDQSSNS